MTRQRTRRMFERLRRLVRHWIAGGTPPAPAPRFRAWRSEHGAEIVELALSLPILMLVVLGIADFGLLFQRYEAITNAAREGARIGVLPQYQTSDAEDRVDDYIEASGLPARATTRVETVTIAGAGQAPPFSAVKVSVEYPHTFVFVGPLAAMFGGGLGSITLRASVTMRSEKQLGS